MDVIETLKSGLAETGRIAVEKAKLAKDILVVREQIRSKKKEIKTLTYKIGLTYMEIHPDDYEEAFADFIRGIKEAEAEMEAKQAEFEELKSQIKPESNSDSISIEDELFADVDIEDLEDALEEDVEEAAEEIEEAVEEIPEEIEETAEAVEEAVEETEE